ncbi:unannotated protein [freshwater metagenome]|uniref:Unannotated protein n=1 Tax=freshwater metagenome TaxID=449393 RepID=A0A6J7GF19_9ZZZZ
MTLHDVPTQTCARVRRTLEIDSPSGGNILEGAHPQGLPHDVGSERVARLFDDGETHAAAANRVAVRRITEHRSGFDCQAHAVVGGRDGDDLTFFFNESRKHQASFRGVASMSRSLPRWVTF